MKKIYFYAPSVMHSVDAYKMQLVPKGFKAFGSAYLANPLAKAIMQETGARKALLSSIYPIVSDAYNFTSIYLARPKKRKFFSFDYDIVHSVQALLETNLPYVVDMEHPAVFCGFNQCGLDSPAFSSALKRELESENLKKILPMSDAARRALLNSVKSEKVEAKTETVYPVAEAPAKMPKKDEVITFLFIGKNFYEKGGYETILAFDSLSGKYDIRLNVLSPVPVEIKRKYGKNTSISFYENVPYGKVKELLSSSNCLVFPSKYDTLGFVVIEAFGYGLPVITIDSFALPELVEDGKRGVVISAPFRSFRSDGGYTWPTLQVANKARLELSMNPSGDYINRLSRAMQKIITDTKFRNILSKNAYKEATDGKFSEKAYIKKMGKIYSEALG